MCEFLTQFKCPSINANAWCGSVRPVSITSCDAGRYMVGDIEWQCYVNH